MLGGWACSRPRCACFGGTSATLVNIIQNDIDQQVSRIFNTCSLNSQTAKVLGQTVPAIELSKVYVVNLKCCDILKSE